MSFSGKGGGLVLGVGKRMKNNKGTIWFVFQGQIDNLGMCPMLPAALFTHFLYFSSFTWQKVAISLSHPFSISLAWWKDIEVFQNSYFSYDSLGFVHGLTVVQHFRDMTADVPFTIIFQAKEGKRGTMSLGWGVGSETFGCVLLCGEFTDPCHLFEALRPLLMKKKIKDVHSFPDRKYTKATVEK